MAERLGLEGGVANGDSTLGRRGAATVTHHWRGKPMHTHAEEMCLPSDIDVQLLMQAAATVRPVLRDAQEEIERAPCLPKALR